MRPCGDRVVWLKIIDQPRPWPNGCPLAALERRPVFRRREHVAVAQRGRGGARGGHGIRSPFVARLPARVLRTRSRPITPRQRPARLAKLGGDESAVVHALQHRPQLGRRLARDNRERAGRVRPNVASRDRYRLAWQADEPLDVVRLRVLGILEHDDVPPGRIGEVVGELVDEDPVAIERRIAWVVAHLWPTRLDEPHHVAAVGALRGRHHLARQPHPQLGERAAVALEHLHAAADRLPDLRRRGRVGEPGLEAVEFAFEPRLLRPQALRLVVFLRAAADAKIPTARGAREILVAAHQRGRHRSGRNHERFRLERSKEQCERERDDDRFDRFPTGAERALHGVGGPRLTARIARGHHGPAGQPGGVFVDVHGMRVLDCGQSTAGPRRPPSLPAPSSPRRHT